MTKAKAKRGRPPKAAGEAFTAPLPVRVAEAEKQAFTEAAELAGMPLSAWVRQRLRKAAKSELEAAGKPVAFWDGKR